MFMNLPQLLHDISKSSSQENTSKSEFSSLMVNLKSRRKDTETAFLVYLVFDLIDGKIYFKIEKPLTEQSKGEVLFFGNNSAASLQYYLTREALSLHYLLGSTLSDLYKVLGKYDMQSGELGKYIKKLEDAELIVLANKKGEGAVRLENLVFLSKEMPSEIFYNKEKKKIICGGQSYGFEDFIRLSLDDDNKKNRFMLVTPLIRLEDEAGCLLCKHPDYLEVVRRDKNLSSDFKELVSNTDTKRLCYVCNQIKPDVSSTYSAKFSRKRINKIFTTTTVNSAPYFDREKYDNIYSMCKECYQQLLDGEKVLHENFESRIAGERVLIIPAGLFASFDYKYLHELKGSVDLAFKDNDTEKWLKSVKAEISEQDINLYTLNFIFYQTDGNSVTILNSIEDVSILRFKKIIEILSNNVGKIESHLKRFSLGFVYRIIPVRLDKKGNQLDIGRVLSLYKALLLGEQISREVLYGYAVDALDKGMRQLTKKEIDNYKNMNVQSYIEGEEDFFIKRILMSYLVLLKTCQELSIINKKINNKGGQTLIEINTKSKEINESIEKMEGFLEEQEFDNEGRALFYLGILIDRVAVAQRKKQKKRSEKNKPQAILKKIQFQGMNSQDILRLYNDTVEKLRQHEALLMFATAAMNRFHFYYGSLDKNRLLNEQANVFYTMSGYAYMVGNKVASDVETSEEEQEDESAE